MLVNLVLPFVWSWVPCCLKRASADGIWSRSVNLVRAMLLLDKTIDCRCLLEWRDLCRGQQQVIQRAPGGGKEVGVAHQITAKALHMYKYITWAQKWSPHTCFFVVLFFFFYSYLQVCIIIIYIYIYAVKTVVQSLHSLNGLYFWQKRFNAYNTRD